MQKPLVSSKFSRSQLERLAAIFRVFGDATRLALLQELKTGPKQVSALVHSLNATQANISRQLKLLHAAGLLSRTRAGTTVVYTLSDPLVLELCQIACRKLNEAAPQPMPDFSI